VPPRSSLVMSQVNYGDWSIELQKEAASKLGQFVAVVLLAGSERVPFCRLKSGEARDKVGPVNSSRESKPTYACMFNVERRGLVTTWISKPPCRGPKERRKTCTAPPERAQQRAIMHDTSKYVCLGLVSSVH
jgi:hypothetical protein